MKFLQGCMGCMGCMSGVGCYNNPSALAGTVRMSDSADGCGACMGCMRGTGCMNSFGLHGLGTAAKNKPLPKGWKESETSSSSSNTSASSRTRDFEARGYKSGDASANQNPQDVFGQRKAMLQEKKQFFTNLERGLKIDTLISDLKNAKDKEKVSDIFAKYSTQVLKISPNSKQTIRSLMSKTMPLDATGLKKLNTNSDELAFLRLSSALKALNLMENDGTDFTKLSELFANNKKSLEQIKALLTADPTKQEAVANEISKLSLANTMNFLKDKFCETLATRDVDQEKVAMTDQDQATDNSATSDQVSTPTEKKSLSGTQIGLIAVGGLGILGAAWYFMSKKKD